MYPKENLFLKKKGRSPCPSSKCGQKLIPYHNSRRDENQKLIFCHLFFLTFKKISDNGNTHQAGDTAFVFCRIFDKDPTDNGRLAIMNQNFCLCLFRIDLGAVSVPPVCEGESFVAKISRIIESSGLITGVTSNFSTAFTNSVLGPSAPED